MRIILTGGAGFIGSCLLWKLNDVGIDNIIVVDHDDDPGKCKNLQNKKYQEYLEKDAFLRLIEGNKLKKADLILR